MNATSAPATPTTVETPDGIAIEHEQPTFTTTIEFVPSDGGAPDETAYPVASGTSYGSEAEGVGRHTFDRTYSAMVGEQVQPDQSRHEGVILSGSSPVFEDISKPLQTSSFSGSSQAFSAQVIGERFYFGLYTGPGQASKIYSVDLDTWTTGTPASAYRLVGTLTGEQSGLNFAVDANGSITTVPPGASLIQKVEGGYTFNSAGMIDASHYLLLDQSDNALWSMPLASSPQDSPLMNPQSVGKRLTPVTSRTIKSAAVKDDDSAIAFLAEEGTETLLYTVPTSGGEPTEVPGQSSTLWSDRDTVVGWH